MSELMSAIAAGASALAGIAAAVAAFRSAKSSEESKKLAESVELRSLLREISTVVVTARAEHMKIQALADRLEIAYRRSAVSTGGFGGSRQKLVEAKLQLRVEQAQRHIDVSAPFIEGTASLLKATSEDATRVLHNQQFALGQLQATSSELTLDLNTVESQLLQLLQSQLNSSDNK
jgi:hypothetical protein